MKIKIENLDKSIGNLVTFKNALPHLIYNGMRDSAILLQNKIKEVDPKYGDTTVIEEYPGAKHITITIGPSISVVPLEYMGERVRYMKFICPWWKTISKEIVEKVPSSSEISNVVNANIEEVKNIIMNNIKLGIRW